MASRRCIPLGWLLVASFMSFASNAHAGDVARARKIFAEGVHLYQTGDWEGARRLFREADAEHHAPAIVYNIGLAEEKLGHLQAALDLYGAYVAEVGGKGDLAEAAAAAIAQIKARTTRLLIETRPAGARVFVDGSALPTPSPTSVLVSVGHHVVVVQGDGFREEREVEVNGAGDFVGVVFDARARDSRPARPLEEPTVPSASVVDPAPRALEAPAPRIDSTTPPPGADGLVWGATFAIAPVGLLGVTTAGAANDTAAVRILAGPLLEVGYALTERFEFLGRAMFGLGPDGKPSYGYAGGPGLSYRVGSFLWVGASFIVGQIETRARNARYGTDIVFGTMLEANVVVLKKPNGEWLAGVQPSVLLTEMKQDNTALFFPISFGYRAY